MLHQYIKQIVALRMIGTEVLERVILWSVILIHLLIDSQQAKESHDNRGNRGNCGNHGNRGNHGNGGNW